jgi:hypothetical protein
MARSRRAQSAQRKRRRKEEEEQQQHEAVRRKSQHLAEREEEEEEERADEAVVPGNDNPVEESNEPELRPQVHKRLSDLQAHVDKHIKQKTQHGDRLKQLTTREDNNAVTVFELDFERQKQLEDLKAAHEQSHNQNPWNTTRDEQRNEQAQETGAEDAQQQSLHQATVTRTKKMVGQELLDELDALQNGRSDGSFLYNYFDKKETAEKYKKRFQRTHAIAHNNSDTDAQTEEAQHAAASKDTEPSELQSLLDELGLKRCGKSINTRAEAFGVEGGTSLGKIARSLQQPIVQLDASVLARG